VLLVIAGGFVFKRTPPAPEPKPVAQTEPPPAEKPAEEPVVAETAPAEITPAPAEGNPAETKPVEQPAPAAVAAPVVEVPVEPPPPPPPPPPSMQFKAWVENIKISGARSGANPKVFIGGTAFQKGDLVNPQLGITFEGYSSETRLLTFKDQTGARVERRH